MIYIPLHVHSEYSLLDGFLRMDEYITKAKEFNIPTLALTEHGNMASVPKFYKKCKENEIKPILGEEFYFTPDINIKDREQIYHITLLAKNIEGYRNLLRLSTLSYKDGFYYKPRIDINLLKQYHEGIICLSGCPAGIISRSVLIDYDLAEKWALQFLEIFKEDYYIEIQDHGLKIQKEYLPLLIQLANKLGIPLVATNDTHYLNREDAETHRILLAIQIKKTLKEIEEKGLMSGYWESDQYYFKSPEEFFNTYSIYSEEAIKNTILIAEKCNVTVPEFETLEHKFPKVGTNATEYIKKYCNRELIRRFGNEPEKITTYYDRMNYELGVIEKLGFMEYFYIIKDIIDYCDKNKIPRGAGRGSVGGSLVAYLLGITNVDPLVYGTLFERFLNPDRVSQPDIDVDISQSRREEVITYLKNKYNEDNVAQIGTYGTEELKSAIRDVARVKYGLVYDSKHIDNESSLEELLSSTNNPTEKDIFITAYKLKDLKRHGSIHAAGVVISPIPITEIIPLMRRKNTLMTQFDMWEVEQVGLIKYDILGLRTVDVIDNTLRLIKERYNEDINISDLPLDDYKTWDILRKGNTVAIFQFEGGISRLLRELQVSEFEEIVACNALAC